MNSWLDAREFDGLPSELRTRMVAADTELHWIETATASELIMLAAQELGVTVNMRMVAPKSMSALELGDQSHSQLLKLFEPHFPKGTSLAWDMADQVQLCRAFSNPTGVVDSIKNKVGGTVQNFPRIVQELKVGKNPADVLDPYILAANFELLSGRSLQRTVETSLSHKVLMKVEDLVGNMHEGVIGEMRGNFRVPAPRGGKARNKDIIHPSINPFPGADLGQVPVPAEPGSIRLFQVKNKTGSAKGGDGERLGRQLLRLEQTYGAATFYVAIVGRTLRGHRSMGAVLRESPRTAVLVGDAALTELTRSKSGAELMLRTYNRAFRAVANDSGYDFDAVVLNIASQLQKEAEDAKDNFLDVWLEEAVGGDPADQDSRRSKET